MIIDLREIRERGQPYRVATHFDAVQLRSSTGIATVPDGAECELSVTVAEGRVAVSGAVRAAMRLVCCRCLGRFPLDIDKSFTAEFVPDLDESFDGEELALTYSELAVGFYHNDELDLTAVVSEQLHLEVPMKPVCDGRCRGLCDQCGADLNKQSCDCTRDTTDPRLDPLRELRNRMTN